MKIRHQGGSTEKVEMQMTPMIDIVFQLLTFFLMSFKIATVEGDFNIKMPVAAPSAGAVDDTLPPIKVKLSAGGGGTLAGITMNGRPLDGFDRLHSEIISVVGGGTGPSSAADKVEVELDCDYNLSYQFVVQAITAVSGRMDEHGNVVKLVQKIKFAPPKKPA